MTDCGDFLRRLEAEYPALRERQAEIDAPFDLARKVYQLRKMRGMTQDDLADAAGIWRWRLAQIERGDANPRLTTLAKLAAALGVQPFELLWLPTETP